MKMLPHFFARASVLALALVITILFVSCHRDGEPTPPDGTSATAPEIKITAADLPKYKFIYTENQSSEVTSACSSLHRLFDAALGIETELRSDVINDSEIGEFEILIGNTNRTESREFIASLRSKDYGYAIVGKKIVIAGCTDDGTIQAMKEFETKVITRYEMNPTAESFLSSADDLIYRAVYPADSIFFGDTDIRDFKIVYPAAHELGEHIAAARIAYAIASECGYTLDVVGDDQIGEDTKHTISVGVTTLVSDALASELKNAGGNAVIGWDGNSVVLGGADSEAILAAADRLDEELRAAIQRDGKQARLSLDAIKKYEVEDHLMSAMSFNHLVKSKTEERTRRVIDMVMKYLPDTIGFQETNADWLSSLLDSELKDIYDYVGEGRDGGSNGEYNPIFYKKSKFNLKESGTRWLSDTQTTVSKYNESSFNRIFTYALLERKSDGKLIMIVNTHLDHKSEAARNKQIKVLLKFIKSCKDYPVILSGDFNSTSTSDVYQSVVLSSLKDSSTVAMKAMIAATFTNYGKSNKTIDFLFVTPDKLSVVNYAVCNEKINGDFPSDHHPVLIQYAPY